MLFLPWGLHYRRRSGYNFDCINTDGLPHELSASGGAFVTKSGMNHRIMVLNRNSRHISLPVLRAHHKLV